MDFAKELNRAVSTGKVYFGAKEALQRGEDAHLFIVSQDCPKKKELMEQSGDVPVFVYGGNGCSLGTLLKKPYAISVITVIDAGASNILDLGK
ncbi:MAG TPA: 50S ribosomal protein L30e [Thermoplasmatales archaeon]|nr:ribosomal L7Ae/L30e/S12e/Gadd45 family protein [Candidatus Thermoplasmatota archaeon]HDS58965.1 50S ribosomal protein L30e [Thermoplasmatales archaeon]